ncbi:MAG: restriction endonuclease subunit S [Candidatus Omnitrophica bacterium]|nr:restriction endonuclease subunit S [Candidatus Omnitrophota bacterium]
MQKINSVIPDQSKYVPEMLYYLFVSDSMQRQIIDNSSSTTLPILNKSKFSRIRVRIPKKKEEQSKIIEEIEFRFSVIDKLEKVVDASLTKAETLRKSILKSAFEGKLI